MDDAEPIPSVRQMREEAIVDKATDLFLDRGIDAVKMTDVADACGVGVASLYRYFGTKSNLAVAAGTLLWRRFSGSFDELCAKAAQQQTGLARVRMLLQSYVNVFHGNSAYMSFLDSLDRTMLAEHVDPGLIAAYDETIGSFYGAFEHAFQAGVADGSIRDDVDFRLFYRSVSHALMGVGQKLLRGNILPSDQFSEGGNELVCIVDMAVGYLASGYQERA